jgi:hypothetical protein
MTELKADRVTIKDLIWEIAQALADKHPEHWETDKVDSDLSLRRNIVAAMNQHGWAPDGIPGLMPNIFKTLKLSGIKVLSTFNGLPFTDEEELVKINPANWWITTDDAEKVKEALQITIPTAEVATVERGITKQQAINAFDGMHFGRDQWSKSLSTVPNWLMVCRVSRGRRGDRATSATWNPADIAIALLDKGIPIKKLDAVFVELEDWAEEWQEKSAYVRD